MRPPVQSLTHTLPLPSFFFFFFFFKTGRPYSLNHEAAMEETEMVIKTCVQELFDTTGIDPKEIDIVITSCSLFNPTPSMAGKDEKEEVPLEKTTWE